MNLELLDTMAKHYADQLLDLIITMEDFMATRDESEVRPNGLKKDECAGFTMKEEIDGSLNLYADVLAKEHDNEALLRVSGIVLTKSKTYEDMFDSLTLNFSVNKTVAKKLTSATKTANVEDIRRLLGDKNTKLTLLRHSNSSEADDNNPSGRMYNITVTADNQVKVISKDNQPAKTDIEELANSISAVLQDFSEYAEVA